MARTPSTLVDDSGRECTECHTYKPWSAYARGKGPHGHASRCRRCTNAWYASRHGRSVVRSYRKTPRGFLSYMYSNMAGRVRGRFRNKTHLYARCSVLPRDMFYDWAMGSREFARLFAEWGAAGYPRRLAPSVDRLDPLYGYEIWNMEWVTQSENSARSHITRRGGSVSRRTSIIGAGHVNAA